MLLGTTSRERTPWSISCLSSYWGSVISLICVWGGEKLLICWSTHYEYNRFFQKPVGMYFSKIIGASSTFLYSVYQVAIPVSEKRFVFIALLTGGSLKDYTSKQRKFRSLLDVFVKSVSNIAFPKLTINRLFTTYTFNINVIRIWPTVKYKYVLFRIEAYE